jgi:hypothetical protein
MNKSTSNQTVPEVKKPVEKRPNETGSISVQGFVRIFDPNTKEKFVEQRA